jgi:hypothetical protein
MIDKSGASYNADHDADVAIRQAKYHNSIVEQDYSSSIRWWGKPGPDSAH